MPVPPLGQTEDPVEVSGRARAISAYREHLKLFPDSPEYDQVNRRLADLLLEEATAQRVLIATLPGDAYSLQMESAQYYSEAISRYENLLLKSPEDPLLLYQLSRAYEESGQSTQALEVIERLLSRPRGVNSRLQSDILFRRGELQFSLSHFDQAESSYRAIVALGSDAPAYEQSLYKLGWSLLKQERYHAALSPFFAFLDYRGVDGAGPASDNADVTQTDREQLEQLFEVISQCFAMLGGADAVADYIHANTLVVYEEQVYLSLATWYESRDQISEAADIWFMLAQREPLGTSAPRYAAKALRLFDQNGFRRQARNIQTFYVEYFGPRSRFWELHESTQYPDEVKVLEHGLLELAHYYHNQSRQTPGFGYAATARQYYDDYLLWFGGSGSGAETRLRLADLLYEDQQYQEAYRQYTKVARTGEQTPLSAEAALGALRANEALESGAPEGQVASLRDRGIEDTIHFIDDYPTHEAAPRLLARAGDVLLEQGDIRRLNDVVVKVLNQAEPGQALLVQVAYVLQAQAATTRGDYDGAIEAYRGAIVVAGENDPRLAALRAGLAAALFSASGQSTKREDWPAAIAGYEEVIRLTEDAILRSAALYDMASAHLALEHWPESIALLQQFRADYPDDPRQLPVSRKLARAYELSGITERAASEYLAIGRDGAQPEALRREALLRAWSLYRQAADTTSAIVAGEYYVDHFPSPAGQAIPIMATLASTAAQSGNAKRQQRWLVAIVALDKSSGDDATRTAAADAALQLAGFRLRQFHRIELVDPVERNLHKKIQAMERSLAAFESAIDYGVPSVTSAATYQMATMYDELGRALLNSERPGQLSADELAEYEELLAEQAAPFVRQAIDIYRFNVRRADAGRTDPWIEKSVEQLHELQSRRKQRGEQKT